MKMSILKGVAVTALGVALVGAFYVALLKVIPAPKPPSPPFVGLAERDALPYEEILPNTPKLKTLWVSASAKADTDGATTTILVTEKVCAPTGPEKPLSLMRTARGNYSLRLPVEQGTCLEVLAASEVGAVTALNGAWKSDSKQDLPDFDQSMKKWSYVTATGVRRKIVALSLDYCESEEGGCSGAVALQDLREADDAFLTLYLPGVGVGPLILKSAAL